MIILLDTLLFQEPYGLVVLKRELMRMEALRATAADWPGQSEEKLSGRAGGLA